MSTFTRRDFVRLLAATAVAVPAAAKMPSLPSPRRKAINSADAEFLEKLQRASFEFFWNEADPSTGLVRDRARANGGDTRIAASIAATGFGLTALCIGYEHNYRPRAEILTRVRRTLEFLATQAPQVHGFIYHFVNIHNGKRFAGAEISPIDMAILLCGVLTCREYFPSKEIHRHATQIYERVDWPWATNGRDTFALEWTPEFGFSKYRWDAYCESMMLYLLAIGSPTHPIPAHCWDSFARPSIEYKNYKFISGPAPLFTHQFSHAWFDFRSKQDAYANYFENSVLASKAHREFCRELETKFPSYAGDIWGITASDSSDGYVAWGGPPVQGPIDGTIVPAAAAGSLPFVFPEAVAALREIQRRYGDQVWTRYGFVDAFNPVTKWVDPDVVGIDVGITLLMSENARTQFIWNTFMRNPEVKTAMQRVGFRSAKSPSIIYTQNHTEPSLPQRNIGQ